MKCSYTGTENSALYSNHGWNNSTYVYNWMFLFENNTIRLIGTEEKTYNAMDLVGKQQFQVPEPPTGYRYGSTNYYLDFGFQGVEMNQTEQNYWAKRLEKTSVKTRTLRHSLAGWVE